MGMGSGVNVLTHSYVGHRLTQHNTRIKHTGPTQKHRTISYNTICTSQTNNN